MMGSVEVIQSGLSNVTMMELRPEAQQKNPLKDICGADAQGIFQKPVIH